MIGAKLRGERFDNRKAFLFLLIIVGFILGGSLGAFAFNELLFAALYIPASICILLALSYAVYTAKMR
jgi:uncharacterized membrane protein YoaK (UPF0700 family)